MEIYVSSFDPAFANFGMALFKADLSKLHLESLDLDLIDLKLIKTERGVSKQVRQNSDDLRRAREITDQFQNFAKRSRIGFTEVPSGAQSARAAYAFGLTVGIIAASPIELIQVQPFETKLATVGTKTASKEEMIEWAVEKYPEGPWIRNTRNGKNHGKIVDANEHLADAVAVAHAGIKTDQFKQLVALLNS
jgi:Holliday junction resolvasome RuvABC endonuclease subunit